MSAMGWLLLAWPLLALAMPKHQRVLLGRELAPFAGAALRVLGGVLLATGLAAFVDARGPAQGPVFWAASLVVTALGWVLLMTLRPRAALAVVVVASGALRMLA